MDQGDFTGARVRAWRLRRGISQKALGELAGLTQGYVSQIEAGLREVDRRSTIVRLAEALRVSVADLTGQPFDPATEQSRARATVPAVRAALVAVSLDAPHEPARSVAQLRPAVAALSPLRKRCEYDQMGDVLPELILDVFAAADVGAEPERRQALRLAVMTSYHTAFVLKYLGFPDLAMTAADCAHEAATALDEPVWTGLADFTRLHSLPPESRDMTRKLARRAAERLAPHLGDDDARQIYGMLHLSTAYANAVLGRTDDAMAHLGEASDTARHTGEGGFADMYFGPTNVGFWRTAIAVELGEGGRIRELTRDIKPERIDSASRQSAFFTDIARALAQTRRHDREAVSMLLRAEHLAPQRVRLNPSVRDLVGAMLRRARAAAGGADLQALAGRVGVA